MYAHIISLTNIGYGTLTSKVIWGHQRSLEVKRRSTLKCSLRDFILVMHSHVISLTNTCYDILTSKVIWGHQRSVEVKWDQIWKLGRYPKICTDFNNFFRRWFFCCIEHFYQRNVKKKNRKGRLMRSNIYIYISIYIYIYIRPHQTPFPIFFLTIRW